MTYNPQNDTVTLTVCKRSAGVCESSASKRLRLLLLAVVGGGGGGGGGGGYIKKKIPRQKQINCKQAVYHSPM